MSDEGLLSELTILDLSEGAVGPFATKAFADYGARVIKVERPGRGDPARRVGPFPEGHRPEAGALFLYLCTSKESVTLDLATTTGRRLLLQLIEHADALIESATPGELDALGLGRIAIEQPLDIGPHPLVDQREQAGRRRVQAIVEVEDPVADVGEARVHAGRALDAFGQTVKLSPQPQEPVAFGFSNTKPAAKSSSRQSITLPTR